MKKILYILLFSSFTCFSQPQKRISVTELILKRKVDSLNKVISGLQQALPQKDTLLIKVDQLVESFKHNDSSWLEKLLPAVLALITVSVSSVVAYKIGVKNIVVQEKNAEKQVKTQLAIAADNLFMSKEQLEQNTKNTIAQIRANNISKSRIEWIQNLRPLLSDFVVNIFEATHNLEKMLYEKSKGNTAGEKKYFELFEVLAFKIQSQKNQVELFLNDTNLSHQNLINSMENYLDALDINKQVNPQTRANLSGLVIDNSRIVLKEAWEKAKSETTI